MSAPKIIFSLVIALLSACKGNAPEEGPDVYFNIDSLLHTQANIFSEQGTYLHKKVRLRDSTDVSTYAPDSMGWIEEFTLLKSININKPVLKGLYNKVDSEDPNSNLKIRTYTHIDPEKAEIPWLKIIYLYDFKKIRGIEGLYRKSTAVSEARRTVKIEFEDSKSQYLIREYEISGYQNLNILDSVNFHINGRVEW